MTEIRRYTRLVPVEDGYRKCIIVDGISFIIRVTTDRLCSKVVQFDNFNTLGEGEGGPRSGELFNAINAHRDEIMTIFKCESILMEIDEHLNQREKPCDWLKARKFYVFGKFRVTVKLQCEQEENRIISSPFDVYVNSVSNPTYQDVVYSLQLQAKVVECLEELKRKTDEDYVIGDFLTSDLSYFRLNESVIATQHLSGLSYLQLIGRVCTKHESLETS